MLKYSCILLFLSCLIHCNTAFAQNLFTETINQELYTSSRSIVNGTSWINSVRYKGNRFCGEKGWKQGELIFEGKKYSKLQLNYDLLADEVILYDDSSDAEKYVQLDKTKISSFNYLEKGMLKSFENIELFPGKGKEIYEIVHKGEVVYYIKHIKEISRIIDEVYMGRLYDKNLHYLKKDGTVYPIRSKKQILQVLGKNTSLKKYIKTQGLSISTKNPESIVTLLRYYESLNTTI